MSGVGGDGNTVTRRRVVSFCNRCDPLIHIVIVTWFFCFGKFPWHILTSMFTERQKLHDHHLLPAPPPFSASMKLNFLSNFCVIIHFFRWLAAVRWLSSMSKNSTGAYDSPVRCRTSQMSLTVTRSERRTNEIRFQGPMAFTSCLIITPPLIRLSSWATSLVMCVKKNHLPSQPLIMASKFTILMAPG